MSNPNDRPYTFRDWYIPPRMMGGIERYIQHGIIPGSFLKAIFANDLVEAAGQADEENLRNLPAYAAWLYNHAPRSCWGSYKALTDWSDSFKKDTTPADAINEHLDTEGG